MKVSLCFVCVFVFLLQTTIGSPADILGFQPLTEKQLERLKNWKETDKENIWELSGQFEGDIILPSRQRNGLLDTVKYWHNRTIPYVVDSKFTAEQKQFIEETLKDFQNLSCITARPKISTDADYVHITAENKGCNSLVGRFGGMQMLNLAPNTPGKGCLKHGVILHEFLHALGFYHQHSSAERDNYITIQWKNIQKGHDYDFNKHSASEVSNFGVGYDYGSVMHYSAYGFSANGEPTIVPKDPKAHIGQRKGLSPKDIQKLNIMYNCDAAGS